MLPVTQGRNYHSLDVQHLFIYFAQPCKQMLYIKQCCPIIARLQRPITTRRILVISSRLPRHKQIKSQGKGSSSMSGQSMPHYYYHVAQLAAWCLIARQHVGMLDWATKPNFRAMGFTLTGPVINHVVPTRGFKLRHPRRRYLSIYKSPAVLREGRLRDIQARLSLRKKNTKRETPSPDFQNGRLSYSICTCYIELFITMLGAGP